LLNVTSTTRFVTYSTDSVYIYNEIVLRVNVAENNPKDVLSKLLNLVKCCI